MKNIQSVGERLQSCRLSKKLSCEKCAARAGVSVETYEKWERGEELPDALSAHKLGKFFGVGTEYILYGGSPIPRPNTMFPGSATPAPASRGDILLLVFSMLMFVGGGGYIVFYVFTGGGTVSSVFSGDRALSAVVLTVIFAVGLLGDLSVAAARLFCRVKQSKKTAGKENGEKGERKK